MTDAPLVRRSPVKAGDCNLARAVELIGDRWMLLILRSALYGAFMGLLATFPTRP